MSAYLTLVCMTRMTGQHLGMRAHMETGHHVQKVPLIPSSYMCSNGSWELGGQTVYLQFTDAEAKAQRSEETVSRPHHCWLAELGFSEAPRTGLQTCWLCLVQMPPLPYKEFMPTSLISPSTPSLSGKDASLTLLGKPQPYLLRAGLWKMSLHVTGPDPADTTPHLS